MKRIIYLLAIVGTLFMGCDPIEDIFEDIDAQQGDVVGDDEITLTSDDYADLGLDFENFNSVDEAKTLLPPFLGDRYPFWGQGSSVIVNYNLYDGNPEEAGDFVNADIYELATEDYPTAASNAFFPNEDPSDFLENILETQIANPTEGQIVRAEFKRFTEEPVIGLAPIVEYDFAAGFEGWVIVEESGVDDVWTVQTGNVRGNGFFGDQFANVEWLVSPTVDLTNESGLKFQITQELDFAGDVSLLKILVSTDYSGDVLTATWDEITLANPATGDMATSEDFDFSAYDGQTINVAFKYTSIADDPSTTTVDEGDAGRWRIAFLALKTTGISGDNVTESLYYSYADGEWNDIDDTRYLSREDYDSMGESSGQPGRFNNFSSSVLPENFLPVFLDIKYPFAQQEDELFIVYRFFEGGDLGTVTKGNLYTKSGANWVPSISTLQFGFDNGIWVPDNTIKHTFTSADIAFISNAFIAVPGFEGPADNMGFFGSFDRRSSSSNFWSDEMLLQAFNALLENGNFVTDEGQKYVLTYVIFNGSTVDESMSVIKTGGVWGFK